MNTERLIGKTIIVGFAYYDETDHWVQNRQFHGEILSADDMNGIKVYVKEEDKTRTLPPRENALFPAPPGEYKGYPSGQLITNPDFISFWKIKKGHSSDNTWEWHAIRLDVENWNIGKEPQHGNKGDGE